MGLTDRDAYDILISVAIGRAMDIRSYCPDDPGAYIADVRCRISDLIGLSRQATVLAFQFGDGFTNMITPCSGVLLAALSVARIPYAKWFKWVWKFILALLLLGFLLLLPPLFMALPGF